MRDEDLTELRTAIDAIDDQLLALFNQRAQLAQRVAEVKLQRGEGGHFHRPEREAQVLKRLVAQNPGPLPPMAVVRLYREIMSACLALERPLVVAYTDGEQTRASGAVAQHFGHGVEALAFDTLEEVLRETEVGAVDYGVVPREYWHDGAMRFGVDALIRFHLQLCGAVLQRTRRRDGEVVSKRFWVVSRVPVPPSGTDVTQVMVSPPDRPGALAQLLADLARRGVNLAAIESRPLAVAAGEGRDAMQFFLELQGHRDDPPLAAALEDLDQRSKVRLLGSYPQEVFHEL